MPRGLKILLVGAGVVVFLVISGLLARFLAVENVEREDVFALLKAEAAGDSTGMLAQLHDCSTSCATIVRSDAAKLRGTGAVKILALACWLFAWVLRRSMLPGAPVFQPDRGLVRRE